MSLLLRSVVTISVLWVIYRVATLISGWRFNIAEARRSGLPYIVTRESLRRGRAEESQWHDHGRQAAVETWLTTYFSLQSSVSAVATQS